MKGQDTHFAANYMEKDRERVDELIRTVCEGCSASCKRIQAFEGQGIWRFEKIQSSNSISSDFVVVAGVFERLHRSASSAGITDWAMGQVTLDDCFSLIVEEYSE